MSWWDTPEGWILGDRPADIVGRAFDGLDPKPELQAVLDAVAAASQGAVRAKLEAGESLTARPEQADPQLVARLAGVFAKIDQAYQERWERPARRDEQLATLSFVLSDAERYFADGAERTLTEFTAG
jgi:hypothetical protein